MLSMPAFLGVHSGTLAQAWTLPSCDPPDSDTDYNPARVLVAIEDRIVTNCRAFGEGERLVVARASSSG
jgi:hypothetical protein